VHHIRHNAISFARHQDILITIPECQYSQILRFLCLLTASCCFLFELTRTFWIWRQHLWSSGQSSWLQIQRSGFDSWRYQILLKVVGMEWGQLSLVSTIEKLFGRKSIGSGLEIQDYSRRDQSRRLRGTLYQQKFTLTSPISSCRSVGIVRSRTQATEFSFLGGDMLMLKSTGFQRTTQRCISENVFEYLT
jgi:hypothetical protein